MQEGNCRHFNGIMSEVCEKDVSYKVLTNKNEFGLPCISSGRTGDRKVAECEHFSPITKEEDEASERESKERHEHTTVALALCVEDSESKGFKKGEVGIAGEIDCPACGKKLTYERSSLNGHIRAACETLDCLRWIN